MLLVTNIQRMCLHDGSGIRTTVFLKGCNLHCPWCANPENISFRKQEYTGKDGAKGIYGKEYTTEQLCRQLVKDACYWKNNGGVTFSGGEPLMQAQELTPLLKRLKEKTIHIAFETALCIDNARLALVEEYTDLFIVDIKILQETECREVLGGNIEKYRENIEYLWKKKKSVIFRMPCNEEYTLKPENVNEVIKLLNTYKEYPVEIFKTHNLGKSKYESLDMPMFEAREINSKNWEKFKKNLIQEGITMSENII